MISKFFASPDGKKMLKVRNGCQKCGIEKKLSVQLHNLLLKLQKKKSKGQTIQSDLKGHFKILRRYLMDFLKLQGF